MSLPADDTIDTSKSDFNTNESAPDAQTPASLSRREAPRRVDTYWEEYFKKLNNEYMKKVVKEAPKDDFTIVFTDGSTKDYKRRKPSFKEFKDLELTRAKFEMLTDPKQKIEMLEAAADIYMKCAKCYFGMTLDEFENCSWEDIKLVLDACNFRTLYGVPFSQTQ